MDRIRIGVRDVFTILRLPIHGSLGKVAFGEHASLHCSKGGMLLAQGGERLLDFLVGDGNLGLVRAQVFVALDLNLRQHLKTSFEGERLSIMHVQIGNAGLRHRNQALFLGLATKVLRNQSLGHIVLKTIAKALFDDGSRHMPRPKPRQPRTLLIALNLHLGFARNLGGRDLNRDLALYVFVSSFGFGRVGSLCGAHVCLSPAAESRGPSSKWNRPNSEGVNLSVKTEGSSVKSPGCRLFPQSPGHILAGQNLNLLAYTSSVRQ